MGTPVVELAARRSRFVTATPSRGRSAVAAHRGLTSGQRRFVRVAHRCGPGRSFRQRRDEAVACTDGGAKAAPKRAPRGELGAAQRLSELWRARGLEMCWRSSKGDPPADFLTEVIRTANRTLLLEMMELRSGSLHVAATSKARLRGRNCSRSNCPVLFPQCLCRRAPHTGDTTSPRRGRRLRDDAHHHRSKFRRTVWQIAPRRKRFVDSVGTPTREPCSKTALQEGASAREMPFSNPSQPRSSIRLRAQSGG